MLPSEIKDKKPKMKRASKLKEEKEKDSDFVFINGDLGVLKVRKTAPKRSETLKKSKKVKNSNLTDDKEKPVNEDSNFVFINGDLGVLKVRKTAPKKGEVLKKAKKVKKGEVADAIKKPKLKKIKKVKDDEIKDPRLTKYILGEENEKFFEKNKLTLTRVTDFVDGLKTLISSQEHEANRLFSDKEDILMQLTCFKIPKTPTRMLRFILPRMVISPKDNILFICKDTIKGRKNTETSENFHKELLRKHKINMVSEVISLTRLKNEYDQYELKRKLLNSYETFLVDGRIAGHVAHFLGKIFSKKRKLPTPLNMEAEDLKEEFQKGLRRTILPLHSTGDCYTVRIGTSEMKTKHIADNLMGVCTQVAKLFPGGWENIRFLRIKTSLSVALPIYVSLASKNKVKLPVVAPKRPRAYMDVEGELTTLAFDDNVIVTPEGTITIKNKKRKIEVTSEDENSEEEIEKNEDTSEDENNEEDIKKTEDTSEDENSEEESEKNEDTSEDGNSEEEIEKSEEDE